MSDLDSVLAQTPRNMDQVAAQLAAIDRLLPSGDGLKWFNLLYLRVTEATRDRIEACRFSNPMWMARLGVHFARYYAGALGAWKAGQPAPGCWRALFARRGDASIARFQFALAGINAHINHDLPMAVVDTFEQADSAPQRGGVQYDDYTALNTTLIELIDGVKQDWMVRLEGDPLPPVSHLENTLAAWSVRAAREAAWTNAELLWDVREVPLIAGRYLDVIDGLTTVAGKALLVPVPHHDGLA